MIEFAVKEKLVMPEADSPLAENCQRCGSAVFPNFRGEISSPPQMAKCVRTNSRIVHQLSQINCVRIYRQNMKVTILGNGNFGSALAAHLVRVGHNITFDEIGDSELIFVCVPSHAVVEVLEKAQKEITTQKIIICSKGFAGDGRLLSEVLKEKVKNDIFFLYGPVIADELRQGQFSSMVLVGGDGKNEIKKQIESENLYIEISDDVIGVEVSAALKNVMTILLGILEGAGYGQNTRAFVFTKGVEEIKKIGMALGGKSETFSGLSCIGDLSLLSRNRNLGISLGRGQKLEEILKDTDHQPEGVFALKNAKIIKERLGLQAPIIDLLYKIMFENYSIKGMMKDISHF